jgi:hypothetical protein
MIKKYQMVKHYLLDQGVWYQLPENLIKDIEEKAKARSSEMLNKEAEELSTYHRRR